MKNAYICIFFCGFLAAEPLPRISLSPAEISIHKAQEQIAQKPDHYPYYNALAMAYARRARETSDVAFYGKAEETLKQSFALAPDNYEGLKVKAWLLLGRHEFALALEAARDLNRRMPDDVTVYGYMVDANVELGNYPDAVAAAQWMLDLRPGNVAGLTRAAYLRELHGDLEGAAGLMQMAYDATPYQESEDRAWILTQMAHLYLNAGDGKRAETYAGGALELFPDYHYALGVLGQLRMAQSRYGDAAALFQKLYAAAPHAENLYALAEALERAGRKEEAAKDFAEFKRLALRESALADNANHELIAYYADYEHNPAAALAVARKELGRRHDVFTLDAYAWALEASGNHASANEAIEKALAVGIRDPKLRHHAEVIAAHLASVPAAVRQASR
ncbi:MAG TPA: tetratricopeptide repeat protein [Bryobacteraceae bacterium]|nr:tetratricopeptide repeat protein [Bryobacteraceae bacterium]